MGLRKGQGVVVDGYFARSHLNGKEGKLEFRDPASGRFRVRLRESPWTTVKAVGDQCTVSEAADTGGEAASVGSITPLRPSRLEGNQAPNTPPGLSSTFYGRAGAAAARPEEPKELKRLEARALRGNIRVKDALRTAVRREVTKDQTTQDVHRLRNTGLSFFREADSQRQPRSRADPVPKPRREPVGRLVLLPSSELQKHFETSEDRHFKRMTASTRLPHVLDPPTPGDSDEDDCELCQREKEAAERAAEEERYIEEHAFDECEACLHDLEEQEREVMGSEDRTSRLMEELEAAAQFRSKRQQREEEQQQHQQHQGDQEGQGRQQEDGPQQTFQEAAPPSRRRSRADDYEEFEADSNSHPGSRGSQGAAARGQESQRPGAQEEDDYEAFEDEAAATWLPGRPPASSPGGAAGPEAWELLAASGPLPSDGELPRPAPCDSVLGETSERDMLKEHLLSVLVTTAAAEEAQPAAASPHTAEAAAAAAAVTAAAAADDDDDDYGDEAFEV